MSRIGETETRPWLLISDIDETLTGDRAAMRQLGRAIQRESDRLWFAVNSSRPKLSVARTLKEEFPPELEPDAIITALGTEISVNGAALDEWPRRFGDWPREDIFGLVYGFGHQPHRAEFQTEFKVSFAIEGADAQRKVFDALREAEYPIKVISSGVSDFDIIPPDAGKDMASLYLAETLGNAPDDIITAGDSGNDLAMFRIGRGSIAVANARQELLEAMPVETSYHSPRRHAAGVLDGLIHYGVLSGNRLVTGLTATGD